MTGTAAEPVPEAVLLAGPGDSTWVVANALLQAGMLKAVILEEAAPRAQLLRRRLRRLGVRTVVGQLAFLPVAAVLKLRSRKRIEVICRDAGLDRRRPKSANILDVPSVNNEATRRLLQALAPTVVIVNGTRIIENAVLRDLRMPVINLHAGITPAYRGVHGGYWAIATGDEDNFGATVHFVDPGIDTGSVLGQARIRPGPEDNYATYPYLQLAVGVPLLIETIRSGLYRIVEPLSPQRPSRLWTHPTLWQYVQSRHRGPQ